MLTVQEKSENKLILNILIWTDLYIDLIYLLVKSICTHTWVGGKGGDLQNDSFCVKWS